VAQSNDPLAPIVVTAVKLNYDPDTGAVSTDAAALQRLVRLSIEIRRQRIAPSEIAGFMKLHPEWATHPADGRSFVWKPSSGEIAIQPVAQQPADRRFSVQIWKGSAG